MSVLGRMDKAKKRGLAVGTVADHGLCIACAKDPTCTYSRAHPVTQCEEFEGYEPRARKHERPEELINPHSSQHEAPAEYKGLCITCANRNTCAFPKPAGGIWHCEEFR